MARPRKGTIQFRNGQWKARHTVTIDGVIVRQWFPLGTDSKSVARAKNAQLLKQLNAGDLPTAQQTAAEETFGEAATRSLERQKNDGLKTWREREQRLRDYVLPEIGHLKVSAVRAGHIREALDAAKARGLSRQTLLHIKNDVGSVFGELWRDEAIKENPVARVQVPKGAPEDSRPRQLLTDEEFAQFMACAEVPRWLRIMALASRCFGGMRTSDLHAWDWGHVDTVGWTAAQVKRPKTKGVTLLAIPEPLRVPLCEWWQALRCPTSGPVFPVLCGPRFGMRRGKGGYSRQLRKALLTAGVTRRELHEDSEVSKCVDFHSFRRAYATALAEAGVNAQTSMQLAGHASIKTHMRYVVASAKPLETPAEILPTLVGWKRVPRST